MAAWLYATVHILRLIHLKVTHFNLYKLYHTGQPLAYKKRQLSLLTAGCRHQKASSPHQRPLSPPVPVEDTLLYMHSRNVKFFKET